MSLLCRFGIHKWDDDCCVRCGTQIDWATFAELASKINLLHAEIQIPPRPNRYGVGNVWDCGQLLAEARGRLPPHLWDSWVESKLTVSVKQADLYIRLYNKSL